MGWKREVLEGKNIDVFDPPERPGSALIFLHGIGLETLVDRPAFARCLDHFQLGCVCPHGQRSWWVDRVCPEFDATLTPERHILDHVVPFMRDRWQLAPRALGVFGISMGGQGALRLAFRHSDVFPAVAGIASALDFHELSNRGTTLDDMYDSKEQARQDTAILQIQPFKAPPHVYFAIDPLDVDWLRGNDRLHEKLMALGIEHTADLTTSHGGHTWEYFDAMAEPSIRFLATGLQAEGRRLL